MAASASGYHIDLSPPHDTEARRNKVIRWIFFIAAISLVVGGPTLFLAFWGSRIGPFFTKTGVLAGLAVGAFLLTLLVPRLLIYNREWSAYVTQDAFAGTMVPYGPGLHPSFLWEERNRNRNLSLGPITQTFTLKVPTKTAEVEVTGVFQYAGNLYKIINLVGVDQSTIDNGFVGFIESFLTGKLTDKTSDEAIKATEEVNQQLAEEFMGVHVSAGLTPVDFEDKYGIKTVNLLINTIKLPAAVQKTRDARDEAEVLFGVVATLYGLTTEELKTRRTTKTISDEEYNRMLNRAMAASDNAKMEIKVVEGNMGAAIADTMFGGAGNKGT